MAGTTLAQGKPTGAGPPPNNNPNLDDRIRQIDEGKLRGAETNAGVESESKACAGCDCEYERRLQAHSDPAQRHRAKSRRAQTD